MSERSKPYFFAFDSEKKHGKKGIMRAHCVRFETIEVEIAGGKNDDVQFTMFGVDYDKDERIRKLIDCAKRFVPGSQP